MDISTRAQQDLHYHVTRFNEKGCLSVWGGDVISCTSSYTFKFGSPHQWKAIGPSEFEGASTQWKKTLTPTFSSLHLRRANFYIY
jgi:hypothetical protein